MFTPNQLGLLQILVQRSQPVGMDELSNLLQVGKRTVSSLIAFVNATEDLIATKRGSGYYIPGDRRKRAIALLEREQERLNCVQDSRFRKAYLVTRLLAQGDVSLQHAADALFVSKTLVSREMREVVRDLEGVGSSVAVDVLGHHYAGGSFSRDAVLTYALIAYLTAPGRIDAFLTFVAGETTVYNAAMSALRHLIVNKGLYVSDGYLIYYATLFAVNCLFFSSDESQGDTEAASGVSVFDEFVQSLRTQRHPVALDADKLRFMFDRMILSKYSEEEIDLGRRIVADCIEAAKKDYLLELDPQGADVLTEMAAQIVFESSYPLHKGWDGAPSVRRNYPYAYELATVFAEKFEAYGISLEEHDIAHIALCVYDLTISPIRMPVTLVIVSTIASPVGTHVLMAARKSVVAHNLRHRLVSRFVFYSEAPSYNPDSTVVVDVGANVLGYCTEHGLTCRQIDPLFPQEDIFALNRLVRIANVRIHDSYVAAAWEAERERVVFRMLNDEEFDLQVRSADCRHSCLLEDGKMVQQRRGDADRMTVMIREHIVPGEPCLLIAYETFSQESTQMGNILLLEGTFARFCDYAGMRNLCIRADFEAYVERGIMQGVELPHMQE